MKDIIKKMNFNFYYLLIAFLIVLSSCRTSDKEKIIIFHAGSLSVPFYHISDEFKKENPDMDIFIEQSGSLAAARKITDLGKNCDILALADHLIIDNIMYPDYAGWSYVFASNEMIIAYNEKSKYANEINQDNWHEILLKDGVRIGRSEPNLDPCGYRTLFVFMLAEKLYNKNGLADRLIEKENTVIRPKEVDLIALLETGNIDYLMIYKSVAIQHNLKIVNLPDEINLSNPEFESFYNSVSTIVDGATQGEKLEITGSSILYGFCIPFNCQNYDAAIKMALFIINPEKGGRILKENGMMPVNFSDEKYKDNIPENLSETLTHTGG